MGVYETSTRAQLLRCALALMAGGALEKGRIDSCLVLHFLASVSLPLQTPISGRGGNDNFCFHYSYLNFICILTLLNVLWTPMSCIK